MGTPITDEEQASRIAAGIDEFVRNFTKFSEKRTLTDPEQLRKELNLNGLATEIGLSVDDLATLLYDATVSQNLRSHSNAVADLWVFRAINGNFPPTKQSSNKQRTYALSVVPTKQDIIDGIDYEEVSILVRDPIQRAALLDFYQNYNGENDDVNLTTPGTEPIDLHSDAKTAYQQAKRDNVSITLGHTNEGVTVDYSTTQADSAEVTQGTINPDADTTYGTDYNDDDDEFNSYIDTSFIHDFISRDRHNQHGSPLRIAGRTYTDADATQRINIAKQVELKHAPEAPYFDHAILRGHTMFPPFDPRVARIKSEEDMEYLIWVKIGMDDLSNGLTGHPRMWFKEFVKQRPDMELGIARMGSVKKGTLGGAKSRYDYAALKKALLNGEDYLPEPFPAWYNRMETTFGPDFPIALVNKAPWPKRFR